MDNKITPEHIAHAKLPEGEKGNSTLHRMNDSHDELTHWALSFLPEINPTFTLDIGCGGGATIKRLVNKYPDTFVHGIDYSLTSVTLSREFNNDIYGAKCEVRQGNVADMPYNNSVFDLITGFETVYFWGDIPTAFAEVHRCLKPDGLFLICCEMSDKLNPRWENVLSEMHIFNIDEWSKLLSDNNFNVISTNALHDEWICLIAQKK